MFCRRSEDDANFTDPKWACPAHRIGIANLMRFCTLRKSVQVDNTSKSMVMRRPVTAEILGLAEIAAR